MISTSLSEPLILLDHVHLSERYPYLYVDTPKTGCSTVKKTLNLAEQAEVDAVLTDRTETEFGYSQALLNLHDRRLMPLSAPASPDDLRAAMRSRRVRFCFTRNPFTRVLSAYIDKIESNEKRRAHFVEDLSCEVGEPTFVEFLRLVLNQPVVDMNPHWRVQTHQTMLGVIDFTHVGAFERFDHDLATILRAIDPATLRFVSAVTEHRTSAMKRLSRFYEDSEAVDLVRRIYAEDFDAFNYDTNPDAALHPPRHAAH